MRRGQEVRINWEMVHEAVRAQTSPFNRFNNPTVSKWDKEAQRVQVKWFGQDAMWFDADQVEKA